MKKRKLIKPRKVVWVMKDFVNAVSSVTYTEWMMPPADTEDETTEEFLARLNSAQEIECLAEIVLKKNPSDRSFAVCVNDIGEPTISMWYNIESLWTRGNIQFAQNFYSRCPMSRGFASVTLSLLHELGHLHSQQEFDGYNRLTAILDLQERYSKETINLEYFKLPDEKAATDWAIEWLADAENRKMAKAFEKEFFKCFAKQGLTNNPKYAIIHTESEVCEMHIYVVICETAYGDAIDKIFTSSPKAYAYCDEQNEKYPAMPHRVEHHWAI